MRDQDYYGGPEDGEPQDDPHANASRTYRLHLDARDYRDFRAAVDHRKTLPMAQTESCDDGRAVAELCRHWLDTRDIAARREAEGRAVLHVEPRREAELPTIKEAIALYRESDPAGGVYDDSAALAMICRMFLDQYGPAIKAAMKRRPSLS